MDWPPLAKLCRKEFDGLAESVQEFLSHIVPSAGQIDHKAKNTLWVFSVKFLQASFKILSENEDVYPQLLPGLNACCQGYLRLSAADYKALNLDVTAVPRMWAAIISKVPIKCGAETFIQLGQRMLDLLSPLDDMDRDPPASISQHAFGCLWNAALKLEAGPGTAPIQVCKLRFMSLHVLCLRPSKVTVALDKVDLALSAFEHHMKSQNWGNGSEQVTTERVQKFVEILGSTFGLLEVAVRRAEVDTGTLLTYLTSLFKFLLFGQMLAHMGRVRELCEDESRFPAEKLDEKITNFLQLICALASVLSDISAARSTESSLSDRLDLNLMEVQHFADSVAFPSKATDELFQASAEVLRMFVRQVKSYGLAEKVKLNLSHFELLLQILSQCRDLFLAQLERSSKQAESEDSANSSEKEDAAKWTKSQVESLRAWFTVCYWALGAQVGMESVDSLPAKVQSEWSKYNYTLGMLSNEEELTSERYFLGCVTLKCASICTSCRADLAVIFYNIACQQLSLWCKADPAKTADRIQEVSLLKIHNYLAEAYRDTGSVHLAMDAILQGLSLCLDMDPDDAPITIIMKTWVKLKKMVAKDCNLKLIRRTIGGHLKDQGFPPDLVYKYLKAELALLQKLSPRILIAEATVLLCVIETKQGATEMGSSFLDLVTVLWRTSTNLGIGTPLEYMEEAAKVIRQSESKLLRGRFCLWNFILKHDEMCQKLMKQDSQTQTTPSEGQNGTEEQESNETSDKKTLLEKCLNPPHTIAQQEEEMETLREAVALWEKAVLEDEEIAAHSDHRQTTYTSLFILCADILRCHREFLLELRVLCLAYHITAPGTPVRVETSAAIMRALSALGVDQLPCEKILKRDLLKDPKNSAQVNYRQQFILKLAIADFYLHAGKIKEFASHHIWLRNNGTFTKSLEDQALKGCFARSRSFILSTPAFTRPDFESDVFDYPLVSLNEAVRDHTMCIHRCLVDNKALEKIMGGQALRDSSVFCLLSEYLQSVLALGRAYRHIGDWKRSRCYLKEGLKVSTSQGWVRWVVIFNQELCELYWLAENPTEALHHLMQAAVTLNTGSSTDLSFSNVYKLIEEERHSDTVPQQPATEVKVPETQPVTLADECFGFQEVVRHSAGQQVSLPLEPIPAMVKRIRPDGDSKNGPVYRAIRQRITERQETIADHSNSCACLHCQDSECRRLVVKLGLLSAKLGLDILCDNERTPNGLHCLEALCRKSQKEGLEKQICRALKNVQWLQMDGKHSALCGRVQEMQSLIEVRCVKTELHLNLGHYIEVVSEVDRSFELLGSLEELTVDMYTFKAKFHFFTASASAARRRLVMVPRFDLTAVDLLKRDEVEKIVEDRLRKMQLHRTNTDNSNTKPQDTGNTQAQDTGNTQPQDTSNTQPSGPNPTDGADAPNSNLSQTSNPSSQQNNSAIAPSPTEGEIPDEVEIADSSEPGFVDKRVQENADVAVQVNTVDRKVYKFYYYNLECSDSEEELKEKTGDHNTRRCQQRVGGRSKQTVAESAVKKSSRGRPRLTVKKTGIENSLTEKLAAFSLSDDDEGVTDVKTAHVPSKATHTGVCVTLENTCANSKCNTSKRRHTKSVCDASTSTADLCSIVKREHPVLSPETVTGSSKVKGMKTTPSAVDSLSERLSELDLDNVTALKVDSASKLKSDSIGRKSAARGRGKKTSTQKSPNAVQSSHTASSQKKASRNLSKPAPVNDCDNNSSVEKPDITGSDHLCDSVTVTPLSTQRGGRSVSRRQCSGNMASQTSRGSRARQTPQSKSEAEEVFEASNSSATKPGRCGKVSEAKKTAVTRKDAPKARDVSSSLSRPSSRAASSATANSQQASVKKDISPGQLEKEKLRLLSLGSSDSVADIYAFDDSEDEFKPPSSVKKKVARSTKTTRRKVEQTASLTDSKVGEKTKKPPAKKAARGKTKDTKSAPQAEAAAKRVSKSTPSSNLEDTSSAKADTKTETAAKSTRGTRASKRQTTARRPGKKAEADLDTSIEIMRADSDDEEDKFFSDLCESQKMHAPVLSSRKKYIEEMGMSPEAEVKFIGSHLEQVIKLMENFPAVGIYSQAKKLLAMQLMDYDEPVNPWLTAGILNEAMAVSLRHQYLLTMHKQYRVIEKEQEYSVKLGRVWEQSSLMTHFSQTFFPWPLGTFQSVVDSLPQGWTVCQFTMVSYADGTDDLLLTRLEAGQEPFTVQLTNYTCYAGEMLLAELESIMKDNKSNSSISDRTQWWRSRLAQNVRIEKLLEAIEEHWLGSFRCMLVGQRSDAAYQKALSSAAKKLASRLKSKLGLSVSAKQAKRLLEFSQSADPEEHLPDVISELLQVDMEKSSSEMSDLVSAVCAARPQPAPAPDGPVILVLDRDMHGVPWENLPVLINQQVTRVPSLVALDLLHHSHSHPDSVTLRGVHPEHVFYVLDPEQNLPFTKNLYEEAFAKRKTWTGVLGKAPAESQVALSLAKQDMYIYAGHGNGCRYLSNDELLTRPCRAVALLMGCCSASIESRNRLDHEGYIFNYLLARCPSVAGCLWDVTDKDIDRYLIMLLELWLDRNHERPPSLASLVQQARDACKMRYLVGAAPVVYGLPVTLGKP